MEEENWNSKRAILSRVHPLDYMWASRASTLNEIEVKFSDDAKLGLNQTPEHHISPQKYRANMGNPTTGVVSIEKSVPSSSRYHSRVAISSPRVISHSSAHSTKKRKRKKSGFQSKPKNAKQANVKFEGIDDIYVLEVPESRTRKTPAFTREEDIELLKVWVEKFHCRPGANREICMEKRFKKRNDEGIRVSLELEATHVHVLVLF
jgi:hypothetical protein